MGTAAIREPDLTTQIRQIVKEFRNRWGEWILRLSVFSEKLAIVGTLISLYRKHGDNPMFRQTMENLFIRLMEKRGLTPQNLKEILGIHFLPEDVRDMVIEDIEEAQETIELRKYLENNKEKVYRFLSQYSVSEG